MKASLSDWGDTDPDDSEIPEQGIHPATFIHLEIKDAPCCKILLRWEHLKESTS